ncbi:MAG: hypothetical protein CVU43_12575 [Chloroflexi bacterium HGW-Chloroflexi-5]|nr:MAG: hypothetical protein CVU43_12575 [Chloroflexi bacterium HGW-Chloroflexi-5]
MSVTIKGVITISKVAALTLGLKSGDEVAFYQDEKASADWYLKKEKGVKLRQNSAGGMLCNCASVARSLLKSIDKSEKANMMLATEPIEGGFYAIITRAAK